MSETDNWQDSSDSADFYEQNYVRTRLGPWAAKIVELADIKPGYRVLDVGCGTGILAREAKKRVGVSGKVAGLDINEGMLATARRIQPEIEWRKGDALELPFENTSFDVVVSQFALMYFLDRFKALQEMKRVLVPGGWLIVAVWGSFERAKGYVILADIAQSLAGEEAANIIKKLHVLGDEDKLRTLFEKVGFDQIKINVLEGYYSQRSLEYFIESEVKGTPLDGLLNEAGYKSLLDEARVRFEPFLVEDGKIVIPMDAVVIKAQK